MGIITLSGLSILKCFVFFHRLRYYLFYLLFFSLVGWLSVINIEYDSSNNFPTICECDKCDFLMISQAHHRRAIAALRVYLDQELSLIFIPRMFLWAFQQLDTH